MSEHDVVREEDGYVECRCGKSWSRESTGECLALHGLHFVAETIGKPGVDAARAALENAKGE